MLDGLISTIFSNLLLIACILFVVRVKGNSRNQSRYEKHEREQYHEEPIYEEKQGFNYSHSYQRKYLFSRREKDAYWQLKGFTDAMSYQLFTKVRLFDLIEPIPGTRNYKGAQWKIQAKHLDFVICDKNLNVMVIVELDDDSHNRPDRQQRDYFVDTILSNNGYKVFRTRIVDADCLQALNHYINE